MAMVHITAHAVTRAMERIPGCKCEDDAKITLTSPAIVFAAEFGAHYVRLGTGQRVVIEDHCIVTVLPSEHYRRQVKRHGLGRYGRGLAHQGEARG